MRSEYCLAGDYGFAKDKGDRWMTEESYVDTQVREFADYIDCDPELAQKLYFQNDVPSTLDNEQKASMGRELSTLQIVSNNLDKAAKACKGLPLYDDQLRNALRIQGLDLQKQIEDLNRTLKDNMDFFYASIAEETSGTVSDHKANTIAKFVASVFLATNRSVGSVTNPLDPSEPSTPYARAVRDALLILRI